MDLTSHPEISGSTVLHIYDVQRGTGSPVQPTSMWCVVCIVLLGTEPSQVEHSWLASCSYGSTHLQYIPYIGEVVVLHDTRRIMPDGMYSDVLGHALDVVLLDT